MFGKTRAGGLSKAGERAIRGGCAVAFSLLVAVAAQADVLSMSGGQTSLEFVRIGNPGNAPDTHYGNGTAYGSVSYTYNYGKFAVTAGQYCEFLNAVGKTDTYGLYYTNMDTASYMYGCNIKRTGSSGSYNYSVAPDWANRPVNLVSWLDAVRFCNWLTNGQRTGSQDLTTTEDGSYYLNGTTTGVTAEYTLIARKPGARYVLPTESEWYKSAYHKNDGVTGNYWTYPTQSDIPPVNTLSSTGTNNANFNDYYNMTDHYTIGSPYWRTEVGAFAGSPGPYGTFDQTSNVLEWLESEEDGGAMNRGMSFLEKYPSIIVWGSESPWNHENVVGFRVAEVPEPATLSLLALGGLALLRRSRRK
jgi:sulfatase modifying factor 1